MLPFPIFKQRPLLAAILLLISFQGFSQDRSIDSLKQMLKVARHDTVRYKINQDIADHFENYSRDSVIFYHRQALQIAKQMNDELRISKSLLAICFHYHSLGNNDTINYYYDGMMASMKKLEASKDPVVVYRAKDHESTILNNMGIVNYASSNYPRALDFFFKSLKISDEIKNTEGQAYNYGNIARVYNRTNELEKATEYLQKAIALFRKAGNTGAVSRCLQTLGIINYDAGNFTGALKAFLESMKLCDELGDIATKASNLGNLGAVCLAQADSAIAAGNREYAFNKKYPQALEYFFEAIDVIRKVGSRESLTINLCNVASVYKLQKNYVKALEYYNEALSIATESNLKHPAKDIYGYLSELYEETGKPDLALKNYKLSVAMRDSIFNEENTKEMIQKEIKFNYEKKALADSVKVAEEKKLTNVRLEQEKNQRVALYCGLALVLVFAGFMFNRFKVTQRQKNIIEQKEKETSQQKEIITAQKNLVEEKHKEITDSINYAERIQRSFLATRELLDGNLSEYFIFFKPKDVVSGDFYWASLLSNGHFALAVADSTGHGVPGAIMSLLNVTSLEKATEHHVEPSHILDHTRKTIIERLRKDGSEEGGKDGMDCSLLVFDHAGRVLKIAAANNPVWIVRNGVLTEIRPDKMPVGKSVRDQEAFTLHTVDLQAGDLIYALTDGFPDQFGGPKGKKFMSKALKELLTANAGLPLQEQRDLLEATFSNWKGDLEQIDDVCLIGIKI